MAWDLDTAKQYLGIIDDSLDALVQKTMDEVMASVELVLQRELLFAADTFEAFDTPRNGKVLLPRFPIKQVTSVDGGNPPMDIVLNNLIGWVYSYEFRLRTHFTIDYEGGYEILPVDLERVMYEALMSAWKSVDQETGGPKAEELASTGGEVSQVTLNDFMSVKFDTGSGSSEAEDQYEAETMWGALYPWRSVLQMYRSERGVGMGLA